MRYRGCSGREGLRSGSLSRLRLKRGAAHPSRGYGNSLIRTFKAGARIVHAQYTKMNTSVISQSPSQFRQWRELIRYMRAALKCIGATEVEIRVDRDFPALIVTDDAGFEVFIQDGVFYADEDIDGSCTMLPAWHVYGLNDFRGGDSTIKPRSLLGTSVACAVAESFLVYRQWFTMESVHASVNSCRPQA